MKICIINYGMGNLTSVAMALEFLGADYFISGNIDEIKKADAYILPGVGSFHIASIRLNEMKLPEVLTDEIVNRRKPILGICLGMQLMAEDSEEGGKSKGLGWIEGNVVKMSPEGKLKIPHVGWNNVEDRKESALLKNIEGEKNFYFDHSYQLKCPEKYIIGICGYGGEVVSAIQHENIMACQFHPEKSQRNGLKLMRNFLNIAEGKI